MSLSNTATGSSKCPATRVDSSTEPAVEVALEASITDTRNSSEGLMTDKSRLESSVVKPISQNYHVDELRSLLNDIYCSTVHSLNLEVIQVWLQVVQDIRDFLRAHEERPHLQLYSKAMHLRLTTCWNEILYAIIGHVRHAPNLLGQTFQKSASNKKLAINGCIACFCHFCNEVGQTWNKGVSDILALLRDILTILQEHEQDTSLVENWIRQAEVSQTNISTACAEFQKTFKVLNSLVDDDEMPSEAFLMHRLLTVCTGDTRQGLETDMISNMQDNVLMSERRVSSAAVLQAKMTMLNAWNETVSKLLSTFLRSWIQDAPATRTEFYITVLESFHGSWARILSSVMLGTDVLEGDFIRAEVQPSAVKLVQAGVLNDLNRETELIKAPRLQNSSADGAASGGSATVPAMGSFTEMGPLTSLMYKNWLVLARAVEKSVQLLGELAGAARRVQAPVDQALLSRMYQGAAACLERYEKICSLLRHFALYESNTCSCVLQLNRAYEMMQQSVAECVERRWAISCTSHVQFSHLEKLHLVKKELTILKLQLLGQLKECRKDRMVPENYVLIFRSRITDWIAELENLVKDVHQVSLATQDKLQGNSETFRARFHEYSSKLIGLLEEGYENVVSVAQKYFANEVWKIDDISILAHLSKSRSEI